MFTTFIHLACNVLGRLVALDEGDGLLNFKTVFKPISRDYEGTNAPLIIAVLLSGGTLELVIRHTIIRVLGTCLVFASLENKQHHTSDSEVPPQRDETIPSASVFSLLRRTKLLRARVRCSIAYAFAYSFASGLCNSVASSISDSYVWLTLAELATAVLLERIHFRWTNSIVGRTSQTANAYHWREVVLPTIFYAFVRKLVAESPTAIGSRFVAEGIASTDAVATRDIVVLATAFALRFFCLYPAWASLIAFETRRASRSVYSSCVQDHAYAHILIRCNEKVLLRLSALHLQAAGIMIGIETVTYIIATFLLYKPTSSAT